MPIHGDMKSREKGFALWTTMFFLFLLTLLGLAATNESIFEVKMVGNQSKLNKNFYHAEAAINLAVRQFRSLDMNDGSSPAGEGEITRRAGSIVQVLNDTSHPDGNKVGYKGDCFLNRQVIAEVEVKRLFLPKSVAPDSTENTFDVSFLSKQANTVPKISHRYYDGSTDKKRFAITATAKDGAKATNIWVQKGISLPAKQNGDLF